MNQRLAAIFLLAALTANCWGQQSSPPYSPPQNYPVYPVAQPSTGNSQNFSPQPYQGIPASGGYSAQNLTETYSARGSEFQPPAQRYSPAQGQAAPRQLQVDPRQRPPQQPYPGQPDRGYESSRYGESVRPAGGSFPADPPPANSLRGGNPQPPPAAAVETSPPVEAPLEETVPTVEIVQKQLAQVQGMGDDHPQKQEWIGWLNTAIEHLQTSEAAQKRSAQFQASIEGAPAAIDAAKKQLAQSIAEPAVDAPADATIVQLEQRLGELETELANSKKGLTEASAKADPNERSKRKAEIAQITAKFVEQQTTLEADLAAGPLADELPLATLCRRLRMLSRRKSLADQIAALEGEKRRDNSLTELFPLSRDIAQRQTARLEKTVELWKTHIAEQRKLESERQAAEARRKVADALPALKNFAERNAELTEERTQLSGKIEKTSHDLQQTKEMLAQLKEDFDRVSGKVEVAGATAAIGLLLRDRAEHLPKTGPYRGRIHECSNDMQKVQLAQLELEDERAQFADLDQKLEAMAEQVGSRNVEGASPEEVRVMIHELLQHRRQYLDDLLNDYKTYHEDLSDLEIHSRQLLQQVREYSQYIDQRVLWMRSEPMLQGSDFSQAWLGVIKLADANQWGAALADVLRQFAQRPLFGGCVILAVAALFAFRHGMRKRLDALGVAAHSAASLWPTVQAAGLTLAIASLWPLMMWFLGFLLGQAGPQGLSADLAAGLQVTALLYVAVEITRQICRPRGLGEEHFHWNPATMQRVHGSLVWLMICGLPSVFVVTLVESHDGGQWRESLGRIAFIAGMLMLALVLHFVLKPTGGLVDQLFKNSTRASLKQLRYLAYIAGLGGCISLAVLSGLGFSYSADQLLLRMNHTLWLVLIAILALAVLSRGREVVRYHLLKRRRRLAAEERQQEESVAHETSHQLGQFLRGAFCMTLLVGCFLIWADMIPALGVLDQVKLWSTETTVYETVTDAEGIASTQAVSRQTPITLANLLVFALVLMGTYMAARATPGLLQIAILGKLPIDAGGRHAIALITRYLVTLVGCIVAFRTIGVTWSSVQWLAAAMTVGLGFGLQEIFANLVSGIIILLERPIRVGDLVTVNGSTGTVARMQIRATTIVDFERRELIVPNKKFITDDVINWTLTDPITRFTVKVGIAYSSDSALARAILLKAAQEHPLVLKEPEPFALMVGFGDSTKNFELRAFISERKHYGDVTHDIHLAIERAFAEEGIEIAFPQQEITIKGLPAAFEQQSSRKVA